MNNKGVSVIIGVILMVAVTVAIASTVYFYVSGMIGNYDDDSFDVEGNLTRVEKIVEDNGRVYYNLTFDFNESYIILQELNKNIWETGLYYYINLTPYWNHNNEYLLNSYIVILGEMED